MWRRHDAHRNRDDYSAGASILKAVFPTKVKTPAVVGAAVAAPTAEHRDAVAEIESEEWQEQIETLTSTCTRIAQGCLLAGYYSAVFDGALDLGARTDRPHGLWTQ